MVSYRRRFLELAIAREALRFGSFTLKSGRESPYFFNAGRFDSGAAMAALGECYADAALAQAPPFDMLFGPAYKGIPLATAMAVALAARGRDVPVAFNRKEAKSHGEGGTLIGAPLAGRVLVVDDVITAGTAMREALALITAQPGASVAGLLVGLDRQERGQGAHSASAELAAEHGLSVTAVAGLDDLLALVSESPALAQHAGPLLSYRARYGTTAAQQPGDV